MKPEANLAYYNQTDWQRLMDCIDDRPSMPDTWSEWHNAYQKTKKGLQVAGIKVNKIVIDIEELQKFCRHKGLKIDGKARAQFVATK